MKDEYLLLKQAAFLLQVGKNTFENYVKKEKIKTELNRGRRMVKVEALTEYILNELDQYALAEQYFAADSKWNFWKLQGRRFYNINHIVEDDMMEYLTLQQCAYLLHKTPAAVKYMIEKKILCATEITQGKRKLYFIRSDEFSRYIDEQKNKFSLALEYIFCPDSFEFWGKHQEEFKTEWEEKYKKRNQIYYEKKQKIQKRSGRTD